MKCIPKFLHFFAFTSQPTVWSGGDDLKSDFLNLFSRSEAGDPVRLVSWWFSRNIQANPIGVNVDAVRDIIKIFGRKPDNVMNGTLKDLVKIHSCFSTIEIWVSKNSINHFWIMHPLFLKTEMAKYLVMDQITNFGYSVLKT